MLLAKYTRNLVGFASGATPFQRDYVIFGRAAHRGQKVTFGGVS
jgi:hypothetical protein